MERLVLVEASNPWAVQTLERIVAADGAAAPGCDLLTVHRQCPSIGIRSDLVQEVRYADFVSEYVELSRIVSDSLSSHAFQRSLSDLDRDRLGERGSQEPRAYQDVLAALVDLGFKRPQAERILRSVGPVDPEIGVEQLLTEALRSAQAA